MTEKPSKAPGSIAIEGPYQATIEQTVKLANEWLERLLGPAATEIGELLADNVRHWRAKQAMRIVLESRARIDARHIDEPRSVPPSVLIPLLEAASLETEQELHDWWVELLTTASDPSESPVSSAFPRILAELSHTEARILNWMYEKGSHSDSLEQFHSVAKLSDIRGHVAGLEDLDVLTFKPIVSNLCRLGLSEPRHHIVTRSGGSVSTQVYDQLVMSPLGAEFVHACRGVPTALSV